VPFERCCEILARWRPAETPVGIVRAAYRDGQRVQVTTLAGLPAAEVDMLTVIIVGNSHTALANGRMVTARGYAQQIRTGWVGLDADVTVAAVNFRAEFGRIDVNLDRIAGWAERLAQKGVQLVCLPELCLCGYSHTAVMASLSQAIPGWVTNRLVEIAARSGVTLLAGLSEVDEQGRQFISHVVAAPEGLKGVYRKTHLGPLEQETFYPGESMGVFVLDDCTIGIQLCYDSHYPEWATLQACPEPKCSSWLLRRHGTIHGACGSGCCATCRRVLMITAATWWRVTSRRRWHRTRFSGVAVIVGPKGELLAESGGWEEGAAIVHLNGDAVMRIRQTNMGYFLDHRRPELYRRLTDGTALG
jgi:N-carbamoylputrescine amidase